LSSIAAITFSTTLVVLLPFREMTSEIAARTQPNTLDLIIALFSGAVGALAISKSLRGVATSIPGVAIAVALMPPLCVTGYGVGVLITVDRVQGLSVVRGGALLFVTNLVAITFSSMLVFLALHFDAEEVRERIRGARDAPAGTALPFGLTRMGSLPARLLMVGVMVAIVCVPLKRSFDALVAEIRTRQELNAVEKEALMAWERLFGTTAGGRPRSYIDRFEAAERDGKLVLSVRVFTTEAVSEGERQTYIQGVARELRRAPETLDLTLVEIPTSQYKIATGKADAKPASPPTLGERVIAIGDEARRIAKTVALPPGFRMLGADLTITNDVPVITVTYLAPESMSADAGALVAQSLREHFDLPRAKVTFAWAPTRLTVASFGENGEVPVEEQRALERVAEATRRDEALRVTLQASPASADRSVSVSNSLQALGVAGARISAVASEGVPPGSVALSITPVDG
jgi:hypothetical protein